MKYLELQNGSWNALVSVERRRTGDMRGITYLDGDILVDMAARSGSRRGAAAQFEIER